MNLKQAMAELERCGSDQTARTYRRHGAVDPLFGVKYADLDRLTRKIKTDQDLAERLWATGNHDARALAAKVADPAVFTVRLANSWMRDSDSYILSEAVGNVVARSPVGVNRAELWRGRKGEWPSATGWSVTANLALIDGALTDAQCNKLLTEIRATIHESPNRTRHEMNGALIAIGAGHPDLADRATGVAISIGPVDVDHGDTSCKTPDAADYIRRVTEPKERRGARTASRAG